MLDLSYEGCSKKFLLVSLLDIHTERDKKIKKSLYSVIQYLHNNVYMAYKSNLNTSLRKHAYSNILKISPPKTENLQIQKF